MHPKGATKEGATKEGATDGTRMIAALATRELGTPVNRKRAQRIMRTHRLLQRSRNELFPLDQAPAAYDRMMSGDARFRVVMTTS